MCPTTASSGAAPSAPIRATEEPRASVLREANEAASAPDLARQPLVSGGSRGAKQVLEQFRRLVATGGQYAGDTGSTRGADPTRSL